MRFEIQLDELASGYAGEFKPKGSSGPISIIYSGFVTSEDGEKLVTFLNGVSQAYLSKIPPDKRIKESSIDSFLAVIRKDKTATLYVNDIKIIMGAIPKKDVKAGDPLYEDDIAFISNAHIEGVSVPDDCSFVLVLSSGWRKALLFDYSPFIPDGPGKRDVAFESALTSSLEYVMFQSRFNFSEATREVLFRQRWFPFSAFSSDLIKNLKAHAENNANIDGLSEEIRVCTLSICKRLETVIASSPLFKGNEKVLQKSLEHYRNSDYLSCTAMLYPRIEGLLRSWQIKTGNASAFTQSNLSESAVTKLDGDKVVSGLLLPQQFKAYLEEIFFAPFDPTNVNEVSRHSVAHGVAPEEKLNEKAATIGILILNQIFYLMSASSVKILNDTSAGVIPKS